MYDYKIKGHGMPMTYVIYEGRSHLSDDEIEDLFSLLSRLKIKADEINLIPKFKAVDFEKSDGEFVFLIHSKIELNDNYLEELCSILFGDTAIEVEGSDHLWVLYPGDSIEIERVKKTLIPFL